MAFPQQSLRRSSAARRSSHAADPDRMSEDEIQEWRDAFDVFDRDRDGAISAKELGSAMRSLGMDPSEFEIQELLNEVDTDGTGTIYFSEFLALVTRPMDTDQELENELREAFRVFDKEGNGFISVPDLRHVMMNIADKMAEEEVDEMMEEADVEGDGQVCYEEFIRLMINK
ncbi:calmodulin-A-like isoform X2 [Branchiostoma floridae]|uniref:Calmodulin-A-like isoform X2 n=1 Tax=Branchiostoma floridae TaxID=7739 RepID=A0A9J7MBK3_BRAFL|nr:calmodulin-A-like isoform X2 [Branchiostoma floridae]